MAATEFTLHTITRTGAAEPAKVAVDVPNGNQLSNNNGRIWLALTNPGGAAKNIIAQFLNPQDGVVGAGRSFSVPAGATRLWGPFPPEVYGQTVQFTHEAGSTTTALAVQLGS
jgi:hypothetical protein